MTSNLVWEHLSSSSTSGPNLVILALMVSKRSRCHDDDGDDDGDDDDGVRGLCHKRLRQLRWARALKTGRPRKVRIGLDNIVMPLTSYAKN